MRISILDLAFGRDKLMIGMWVLKALRKIKRSFAYHDDITLIKGVIVLIAECLCLTWLVIFYYLRYFS